MDTYQHNQISAETRRTTFVLRLQAGGSTALHHRPQRMAVIGYLVLAALVCICYPAHLQAAQPTNPFAPILSAAYARVLPLLFLMGLLLLLYCIGRPRQAAFVQNALQRAGVVNHAGEAPILLHRNSDPKNSAITVLELYAPGIPATQWEDKRPSIETALDCYVVKIIPGIKNNRVLLHCVSGGSTLPERIPWIPEYHQDKDDSTLVLGQSRAGPVTVDIQNIPHILIGGSTGSGKSILLKSLLFQLHQKNADIIIADFKGGVDFTPNWKKKCRFITTEEELLDALHFLSKELQQRQTMLLRTNCTNLRELNAITTDGTTVPRLVFACDEVAELFDKTGRSKADRERIDQIISYVSTIARLGRAFGIHLILATQRPDAQILPGQIKNNIDCKLCGRADNVLSQIILDSTDAADLIPKDSHLFLRSDGIIFQPYLINEEEF